MEIKPVQANGSTPKFASDVELRSIVGNLELASVVSLTLVTTYYTSNLLKAIGLFYISPYIFSYPQLTHSLNIDQSLCLAIVSYLDLIP